MKHNQEKNAKMKKREKEGTTIMKNNELLTKRKRRKINQNNENIEKKNEKTMKIYRKIRKQIIKN